MSELKTPLYDVHAEEGGMIVPFAGCLLPVQYESGVIAAHMAVLLPKLLPAEHLLRGHRRACPRPQPLARSSLTGPKSLIKRFNLPIINDFGLVGVAG